MRMPGATIYELDGNGMGARDYDDLAVVNLWRRFLISPDRVIEVLFGDDRGVHGAPHQSSPHRVGEVAHTDTVRPRGLTWRRVC